MSISGIWPLYGLRIRTPLLELRLPTLDDLAALAKLGLEGIYDPSDPHVFPVSGWTSQPSPHFERWLLQHHWRAMAEWTPSHWEFIAIVDHKGEIIGTQDAGAKDFGVARSISTGSWLGRTWQGRGLGKEMREAILHLAFDGLGARAAYSSAWEENGASLGVSRSLGYRPNGTTLRLRGDETAVQVNMVLYRADWEARRREDIEILGLEPCLEYFTGWQR